MYGNIYDFPVDYVPLNGVKRIYDTHRYLMENMALYKMFRLIKKAVILMSVSSVMAVENCLVLKDQDCPVRKVIIDNDYMTFPYKIKVDKCIGSCNGVENPYFKVCLPDAGKNISVKTLDLISRKNVLKIFHSIIVVNVVVY